MKDREFDVIVFGATGFVGRILCRHLFARHGAGAAGQLRWAAAARSQGRLEALRDSLGEAASGLSLIVADAADGPALRSLCARARVVASTVGPYALHGETLVRKCALSGTDYCDLTGEVPWIRRMIEHHQPAARASGARIVHCCGFDSIPSDLGVSFLQQEAMRRFARPCISVKMRVKALRGGVSGGTVASMLSVAKQAAASPAVRGELADPYSLCGSGFAARIPQSNVTVPDWDADFGSWCAPFVMAAVNTRVVHRSNALQGHPYGVDFHYDEATLTGPGARGWWGALGTATGLGALMIAGSLPPTRWPLERWILPAPGEGPSPEAQRSGFFELHFLGTTAKGDQLGARVTGNRDPGYGSTAGMLGEAAACLARDVPRSAPGGGFWTPATALGDRLRNRLQAHAGLTFEVLEP